MLEQHSWPGNTRELENVIHFALLVSTGDEILPEHLNLPEASGPQLQIERLVAQINIGGSVAERKALKDMLIRLSEGL
ncbi:acetoacetate metabolism regulatory protein AtoC [compost metagenome]